MDQTKLAGAGAAAGAVLLGLAYSRSQNAAPKRVEEEKYQGGESYGDPPKVQTGIWEDLKAMGGLKNIVSNASTLIELRQNKGKPDDDKKMMVRWHLKMRCGIKWLLTTADGTPHCSDGLVARDIQDQS